MQLVHTTGGFRVDRVILELSVGFSAHVSQGLDKFTVSDIFLAPSDCIYIAVTCNRKSHNLALTVEHVTNLVEVPISIYLQSIDITTKKVKFTLSFYPSNRLTKKNTKESIRMLTPRPPFSSKCFHCGCINPIKLNCRL